MIGRHHLKRIAPTYGWTPNELHLMLADHIPAMAVYGLFREAKLVETIHGIWKVVVPDDVAEKASVFRREVSPDKPKKGISMTEGVGRPEDEISEKHLRRILRQRQKHDPLIEDVTRRADFAGGKTRLRVAQDKRLFDGIGEFRAEDMELIHAAYRMITTSVGWQTFNPFRLPGGGGDMEKGAVLIVAYRMWAHDVLMRDGRKRLDFVLDIAVNGLGLREAERKYGMRNGSGIQKLCDAIDKFSEIFHGEIKKARRT